MSKAVLVMDMPDRCKDCDFYDNNIHLEKICHAKVENSEKCGLYYREIENHAVKPDWCPLRPVPEKVTEPIDEEDIGKDYSEGTMDGWNACIDAIGGGDSA